MDSNQASTSQASILVVDDTPDNVRLLSTILTEEGLSSSQSTKRTKGLDNNTGVSACFDFAGRNDARYEWL